MEFKWAHYCLHMSPNGWGVDVVSMFAGFGADPGKPLELDGMPVHLGVRVHAPPGAPLHRRTLQASLKANGQAPSIQTAPLEFIPLPSGYPAIGLALIPLSKWDLPSIGTHTVELAVDGTSIGAVPLVIQRRNGTASPSPSTAETDIRLVWAHHAMIFSADPQLPGNLSIGGIFEFLPADPRTMDFDLKGSLLLLHIESDLTIKTSRELRTELLDESGQPARDRKGQLLMSSSTRPITLRRLNPAWNFLASTATVRFERDVRLTPGQYQFRFFLDKKPFGDPLKLTVAGPTAGSA